MANERLRASEIIDRQAAAIRGQRDIIDRLMKHVLAHHEDLDIVMAEECRFSNPREGTDEGTKEASTTETPEAGDDRVTDSVAGSAGCG